MSNGYQRQVKYYQTTKAAFDAKPQDTPEKAQKLEELERAIKAMKGANTTKEQYEKKLRKLRKKIPEGEKKKSTLVIAFETEKAKRDAEEKNGTGSVTIQEAISFPDL
jgi:phage shock protein A